MSPNFVPFSIEAMCTIRIAMQLAEQALPDLVTREMAVNAAEAGATTATFGEHRQFPNKLTILDNGTGMSRETLIDRLPLPGKVPATSANKQVGLRALAMSIADQSRSEHPYLTVVTQLSGIGSAHRLDVFFNGYSCVEVPRLKELGKRSGTLTVIQGNAPSQNTLENRPRGEGKVHSNHFFWVARSLSSRFFDFPKGLTVFAPDYDGKITRVRSLREILQADHCQILSPVECDGVEVVTIIMPKGGKKLMANLANKTFFKALEPGVGTWRFGAQVLHAFGSEILGLETGSSTPVDQFGVTHGRNSVALIVRPTSPAYTIDITRERVIPVGKGRWDLAPIAQQFEKAMPKVLKTRIAESAATTSHATEYRRDERHTNKLVAMFGGMFLKDARGKRERVRDAGITEAREKGFDPEIHPRNEQHPELANLENDSERPFPELRPTSDTEKKRALTKRGGRKERVLKVAGVPDVVVTSSDEGEPLELARLVKRDAVTGALHIDINVRSTPFEMLWNIPGIQAKKVSKGTFVKRLEAAVSFKVLTLLGMALETKTDPLAWLTPRDLTAALLDPTIFDRVRTTEEAEQAMGAAA
jgi:hypothetical protein